LYFNFFSASFSPTFLSADIATSISVHVFSFFVFNYYIWPIIIIIIIMAVVMVVSAALAAMLIRCFT